MIRHLFVLIWNRKRRNFLLTLEIGIAFVVLCAIGGLIAQSLVAYARPLGFRYDNVWLLKTARPESVENAREVYRELQHELQAVPGVLAVAWTTSNTPYSMQTWTATRILDDGRRFSSAICPVGDAYADVLDLNVIEGRWFSAEDNASPQRPVVINSRLRDELFGDQPAVGAILDDLRVVGVVDNYRFLGELDDPAGALFERVRFDVEEDLMPTDFVFTVTPAATAELEAEIIHRLGAIAPAWTLAVRPLASVRDDYFRLKLLGLLLFGSVAGFLILNVALGLFGVLWYSINQRRAEIGLRCAVGADSRQIGRQILGEALVLTTFGVLLGLVIALQFPVLQVFPGVGVEVYGLAIVGAAAFLYLIVSVCAVYPSRLAARIQPAEALRAD